jgi:dTDP-4-amino-4,6-dideoxygalactose transaminase
LYQPKTNFFQMEANNFSRRKFIATVSASSIAAASTGSVLAGTTIMKGSQKLAILGGDPVRDKNKLYPRWPYRDQKVVDAVAKTADSGIWCRIQSPNGTVPTFEKEFAKLMGTKYCLATGSGTQSLNTCVLALGIGAGDEVITSPLTDPGTISSILTANALPVVADVDRETFQIDPADIERKITKNTKAIMPVDIAGNSCNMDAIMAIAKKHNLKVIEDSCQAALNEYRGKKSGTMAGFGCFSFQSSKTIACGEGGAIVSDDEAFIDKCFTVHNHGTNRKGHTELAGPKYRMNEFQAAVLLGQMDGVLERARIRTENGQYLNSRFKGFKAVTPQRLYDGDSGAFYLYMMTYHPEHFNNIPRATFLKALAAEGIKMGPYIPQGLHKEPWTQNIVAQKVYTKMFEPSRLKKFQNELNCPNVDYVLDNVVMIWGSGPLTGTKQDMDDIVNAVMKVYDNRDQLKSI